MFFLALGATVLGVIAAAGHDLLATNYVPHRLIYLEPRLLWTNASADGVIALAYVVIAASLAVLVYRAGKRIPFSWMLVAFGEFLVAGALTHLIEVVVIWKPAYWLLTAVKVLTAVASAATAVLLPLTIPKAISLLESVEAAEDRKRRLQEVKNVLQTQLETRSHDVQALAQQIAARNRELAIANHALACSEERYRVAFEAAAVGFSEVSLDGRWLRVNDRFCSILGYTPEELASLQVQDVTYPEDRQVDQESMAGLLRGDVSEYSTRKRYVRKDGELVWAHRTVSLVRDRDGQPQYFIGIVQDISAQKQAEAAEQKAREALRESEERLRLAQQAGRIMAFVWNVPANTVEFSNPLPHMHDGLATTNGNYWRDHIHTDDLQRCQAAVREALTSGKDYECHYRYRADDGKEYWHALRGRAYTDASGQPSRVFGVVLDVTEQKRANEALETNVERMRLAHGAANMASWHWDLITHEVHWSDEYWGICGLDKRTVPPSFTAWLQSVHPDDREATLEAIQIATKTGEYSHEHRVLVPDGSTRWVAGRGRTFGDPDGKPCRMIGIVMDITERKQAESLLMQAEKLAAAGRLAASVAHEINNPLEAVTNLLYLVGSDDSLSASTRRYVEIGQQEISRVGEIVAQTLKFYRQSTNPASAHMREVFDSVLQLYHPRLTSLGIRVVREHTEAEPLVCYTSELRQVFANLLGNSIDAMSSGGTIRIRSRRAWDSRTGRWGIRITFADNGTGMSEATTRHIFEPFFTTKQVSGTGLGLWVSLQLVQKHEGNIRVRSSNRPGHSGTVFSIFFPHQQAMQLATAA